MRKAFVLLVVLFILFVPIGHRIVDLKYEGVKFNSGELDSCPIIQKGTAHYFGTASGKEFDGNTYNDKTGCGYSFRPFIDMGAASWFYPCGTKLLITNLKNGKSVIATVMDRGPDRIRFPSIKIDLYKRTFDALGGTGGKMEANIVPILGCAPSKVDSLLSDSISKIDIPLEINVPEININVPLESNLLRTSGTGDVLGEKCLLALAISAQNPDLICSPDCGMTWRSLANPGQCYNK